MLKRLGQIQYSDGKTEEIINQWVAKNESKELIIWECTNNTFALSASLFNSQKERTQEQKIVLSKESFIAFFSLMGLILVDEKSKKLLDDTNDKFEIYSSKSYEKRNSFEFFKKRLNNFRRNIVGQYE